MAPKKTTKGKRRRRFGSIAKRRLPSGRVVYRTRWTESRDGPRLERLFDTRKEAEWFLSEVEKQLLRGEYVRPPSAADLDALEAAQHTGTVGFIEYATTLLEDRLSPTRADDTVVLYRANLKALKAFYGRREVDGRVVKPRRLDEVTRASFLDYRAWRSRHRERGNGDGPVSPVTINRDQQFASLVLNNAVIDSLILSNPLQGLKKLKEPRKPRRWLTKAEVRELVDACDDLFRPFVIAMLYTGCRPGELRNLTWGDVSFEGRKLAIFRSKVGNYDALDLHPVLVAELLQLRELRGGSPAFDEHVFLNRHGEPWKDMRRAWKRTVKAAGLDGRDGLTLYSLRHTFATHFLEGGGATTDLQAQLGHADLSTTQRYADLVDTRRRDTVLGLDYESDRVSDAVPTWVHSKAS